MKIQSDLGPKSVSELKVLVVGLGSVGSRHLNNLRKIGCNRLGLLRSIGGKHHCSVDLTGIRIHKKLDAALQDGYDAVIVSNPSSLHMDIAIPAVEAGCHLYIEKPLADRLYGIDRLMHLVREKHLTVMVGCQFRFHPHLIHMEQWLREEKIGKVLYAHSDCGEYLPLWHPWEDYRKGYAAKKKLGGGVVLTLIHELDYLFWLFGPLTTMAAIGGRSGELELDVEDHATCLFRNDRGTAVSLHLDYLQHPPNRGMKVVGTKGSIQWDFAKRTCLLTVRGMSDTLLELPDSWQRNDMFLSGIKHFLQCIGSGSQPKIPLETALTVLETAIDIRDRLEVL